MIMIITSWWAVYSIVDDDDSDGDDDDVGDDDDNGDDEDDGDDGDDDDDVHLPLLFHLPQLSREGSKLCLVVVPVRISN